MAEDKEQELELTKEINEELQKQVKHEEKLARLRGESLSSLEKEQAALARKEQITRQATELLSEQDDELYGKRLKFINQEIERELRKGTITTDYYKEVKKLNADIAKAKENADEDELKRIAKKIDLLKKQSEQTEKSIKAMQAADRSAEGLVDTLGGITGISKDTGSTFRDLATAIGGGTKSLKQFAGTFGKAFAGRFGIANVLGMVGNNQLQVTMGFNKLQSQVLSSTGANYELTQTVEDASRAYKSMGVSFADSGQAITGLYRDFALFSTLNSDTQKRLTGTTAMLQNLGISAETTARNFNFLASEIGMSIPEAERSIRSMVESGASMGIAPQEMAQSFAALSPRMAEFGSRAPKIFESTAIMAKKLGINVEDMGGTLFALSDRLSTFEGSASAVADIGTVLGGSFVNAFDLTMAAAEGPEAQLKLLRKAFANAGKDFNQLGFFEQRLAAQGFGLEVGKVRAILSEGADATKILTGEQKTLEGMSKQTTDLAKAQQMAFENLTKAVNESAKAMQGLANKGVDVAGDGGLLGALGVGLGVEGISYLIKRRFRKGAGIPSTAANLTKPPPIPPAAMTKAYINPMAKGFVPPGSGKVAGEVLETGIKTGVKGGASLGKAAGKTILKKIPLIGLGAGLVFAAQRAMEGDFAGAGLEALSGAASTVPGIGTAASVAIDAGLIAKDMGAFDSGMGGPSPATVSAMQSPARGLTKLDVADAMTIALRSAGGNEQPIKVELYLDSSGTSKIAESTINYIDRNYTMTGNARIPV